MSEVGALSIQRWLTCSAMTRSDHTGIRAPSSIPTAPRIVNFTAHNSRQEQAVAEFPDGKRVSVRAHGTVKVGRQSAEPITVEVVERREHELGGTPAAAFANLRWSTKA